jgi:hypothetical protein
MHNTGLRANLYSLPNRKLAPSSKTATMATTEASGHPRACPRPILPLQPAATPAHWRESPQLTPVPSPAARAGLHAHQRAHHRGLRLHREPCGAPPLQEVPRPQGKPTRPTGHRGCARAGRAPGGSAAGRTSPRRCLPLPPKSPARSPDPRAPGRGAGQDGLLRLRAQHPGGPGGRELQGARPAAPRPRAPARNPPRGSPPRGSHHA